MMKKSSLAHTQKRRPQDPTENSERGEEKVQ